MLSGELGYYILSIVYRKIVHMVALEEGRAMSPSDMYIPDYLKIYRLVK
jgi:hypothetical protein